MLEIRRRIAWRQKEEQQMQREKKFQRKLAQIRTGGHLRRLLCCNDTFFIFSFTYECKLGLSCAKPRKAKDGHPSACSKFLSICLV